MSGKKNRGLGDKGFTLLELLIAIAILAVVMTIVYSSFIQTRKVIGASEDAVEGNREIRAVFRLIAGDLSMAFLSPERKDYTLFVGTDDMVNGYPMDSLDFAAFSHKRWGADVKESDQTVVSYYVYTDTDGNSSLMRREKNRLDTSPLEGGWVDEVTPGILGMDLRYYDGESWLESWDSQEDDAPRIPQAVEVTLIVKDSMGKEHPYRTVVQLPNSENNPAPPS